MSGELGSTSGLFPEHLSPFSAYKNTKMEHSLNRIVDETMSNPGVSGIMCVDEKGLCLSAKGKMNGGSAGLVSGITQQASKLHSDIDRMPVIAIESDSGNIMIKSKERITVAVHKVS